MIRLKHFFMVWWKNEALSKIAKNKCILRTIDTKFYRRELWRGGMHEDSLLSMITL